ncbi:hypothetical protein B566_EDAN012037 [Ephemera danica]|nr:hypothetical protein B566_EDAN012037 [Ephemera danica]
MRLSRLSPTRKVYVPPAQQRILISPERLKAIRSIVCTGLPDSLRDKDAFKAHFKHFGKITRSVISSEKATATVYYQTHEMAAVAKKNGNRGYPDTFKIAWSHTLTRRPSASSSTASRRLTKAEKTKPSSSAMADPEVADELRSMAEASAGDFLGPPRTQTRMDQFVAKRKAPDAPHSSQLRPSQLQVPKTRASTPPTLQVPQPRAMRASTPPPRAVAVPSGTNTLALMEALRKPAFSTEERLAVLDARDKLLRLRGVRGQQVAGLKAATVGTCEDMCPEKERYLREDRHQEGNLSHAFAVKQYSRSSADQELPLPHELRPPRVLRATMNHLLARIVPRIDRVGESVGDWFFFLWDRTRAIRKDITQQELCDLDAVTLVEQCARFHVACSARLAGYELSVFDPKINTENLTKCLQTLKHMYHDTELRGVSCPNEPEFRAYVALLNLNSGDAMREVQELRPEVRMSAPVRRAVQAYLALSNRNYVRFFRVVRSMGFLAASVLMRYFPQVREQALEMLTRALCKSHRDVIQFPLSELMRQLGFESCEDAADFCERCGLDTNAGSVALSRGAFQPPGTMSALKRAPLLVESQLTTSLAEVFIVF